MSSSKWLNRITSQADGPAGWATYLVQIDIEIYLTVQIIVVPTPVISMITELPEPVAHAIGDGQG
jgi:hypothetical protein